jgi:hypothetical protein
MIPILATLAQVRPEYDLPVATTENGALLDARG